MQLDCIEITNNKHDVQRCVVSRHHHRRVCVITVEFAQSPLLSSSCHCRVPIIVVFITSSPRRHRVRVTVVIVVMSSSRSHHCRILVIVVYHKNSNTIRMILTKSRGTVEGLRIIQVN